MNGSGQPRKREHKLSRILREMLGKSAPVEFQDALTIELMGRGESLGKTNADVIAEAVMAAAREGKQWAIELVHDRTEGKPAQTIRNEDADRSVEERINDVTVAHLNELARVAGESNAAGSVGGVGADAQPRAASDGDKPNDNRTSDQPSGAARSLLDLPKDGSAHS